MTAHTRREKEGARERSYRGLGRAWNSQRSKKGAGGRSLERVAELGMVRGARKELEGGA